MVVALICPATLKKLPDAVPVQIIYPTLKIIWVFGLTGRYGECHPASGYSILRPDPNTPNNVISPAAAALFAMPKYSGW